MRITPQGKVSTRITYVIPSGEQRFIMHCFVGLTESLQSPVLYQFSEVLDTYRSHTLSLELQDLSIVRMKTFHPCRDKCIDEKQDYA